MAQRELENWALSQLKNDPNWDISADLEFTDDDDQTDDDWENTIEKDVDDKLDEASRAFTDATSEYGGVNSSDVVVPPKPANCLVMIRHGKTEHNKLGLFTGWVCRTI